MADKGFSASNFTVDSLKAKGQSIENDQIREKAKSDLNKKEIRSEVQNQGQPTKQDQVEVAREKEQIKADARRQKLQEDLAMDRALRTKLYQCKKWAEKFPQAAARCPPFPPNPSIADLDAWLDCIRFERNSEMAPQNITLGVASLFQFAETVFKSETSYPVWWPKALAFNTQGLTQNFLAHNFPQMDPIIEELNLEYPWLGHQPLAFRALSTITSILHDNDRANKDEAYAKQRNMIQYRLKKMSDLATKAPIVVQDLDPKTP